MSTKIVLIYLSIFLNYVQISTKGTFSFPARISFSILPSMKKAAPLSLTEKDENYCSHLSMPVLKQFALKFKLTQQISKACGCALCGSISFYLLHWLGVNHFFFQSFHAEADFVVVCI